MTGVETIHHAILMKPDAEEEIGTLNKVLADGAKVFSMAPTGNGGLLVVLETHEAPAVVARRFRKAAHLVEA
jgi:hypothetical protein